MENNTNLSKHAGKSEIISPNQDRFLADVSFEQLESKPFDYLLDDLFDTHKMENRLEQYGYKIPKLLVQRDHSPILENDREFNLPLQNRDIYEEKSYEEFRKILAPLQSSNDSKLIRFKIDYDIMWNILKD